MTISMSTEAILEAINQVVGPCSSEQPIALHEPDFNGTNAWLYLKDCLDTGWVSTSGKWVTRFEQELSSVTGARDVIAVSNGTVALRLALYLVGVRPGDEVLLPPLSFVATANAVSHLGAVPHFVDIDPTTLAMDPLALSKRLEQVSRWKNGQLINTHTGRRLAAVLPVHVFGFPADALALRQVAGSWDLPLVEDAAEALGSWRQDTHCGLFGSVGTLSFNGNKLITTGGGGALITNDPLLADRARHLSTTAKIPHPWEFDHDLVGWNDRLPNLNAALGVAQLEDLSPRLQAKSFLASSYATAISGIEGVEFLLPPSNCRANNWLINLRFTDPDPIVATQQRFELLTNAHLSGLMLRPVWKLLHHLPMYSSTPRGSLPNAESQACRLVSLPSSPQLVK